MNSKIYPNLKWHPDWDVEASTVCLFLPSDFLP